MDWLKKFGGLLGIEIEIGVVVSIITAVILAFQTIALNGQISALKKQAEIQFKTMKADNLMKLNQQIYPCENMKEIIEAIYNNKSILKKNKGPFTEVVLDNFLGYFEMLGIMEKRGYLDADLINDMFGADIKAIAKSKEIQEYLKSEQEKGYNWPFLDYITQKVEKIDHEIKIERKINKK